MSIAATGKSNKKIKTLFTKEERDNWHAYIANKLHLTKQSIAGSVESATPKNVLKTEYTRRNPKTLITRTTSSGR